MGEDDLEEFRAFVMARSASMIRSAWLMTGSEATAQDLVQSALLTTWQRWSTLRDQKAAEAYTRGVVVTTYVSWRRRRAFHERPTQTVPDLAADDLVGRAELRHDVAAALALLSPRQRAVIALRYLDQLTEAETAAALGCSIGTVKTQAARAIARLRASPALDLDPRRVPR